MLDRGEERLRLLDEEDQTPWTDARGLVVRGYESSIDGSVQPYGLEIPENLDLSKPVPLLVWLHGRGDKITDLHFVQRCLTRSQALGGKVADQQDAIIVHPFGRQCVGWKHAGEIDVLEVIEHVKSQYHIDPDRVALAGFSMGGAGAWHIGAHYTDRFCAVHAGAGFAETARYINLKPEDFPPDYEQTLWGVYDVPNYVRNLFNVPVIAYSGEEDKQKQAADVMVEAFAAEGKELRHVIGPGMGHKYHDDSVKEIWAWLQDAWKAGRNTAPEALSLQTRTLRYPRMHWLTATGLEQHWEDSRADAAWDSANRRISVETKNLTGLRIDAPGADDDLSGYTLEIDGDSVKVDDAGFAIGSVALRKSEQGWQFGEGDEGLAKRPGVQGPIDDAFLSSFIVVPQSGDSPHPKAQRWIDFERNHFQKRWRALMRGGIDRREPREVESNHVNESNLILWGDPVSNPLIAEIAGRLPIKWDANTLEIGGQSFDPATHVPVLIFPNPLNPRRYVVINSGLTFREGHDRTNSLQNPKLPDWAIVNLDQLPDELGPGKIVAAGFFDEAWKVREPE